MALIKTNARICSSCKYHMAFGSQPGREQKEKGQCKNVACNYLLINLKSRIFANGKMAYDPRYCDKYEKGESVILEECTEPTFKIQSVRYRKAKQLMKRWNL